MASNHPREDSDGKQVDLQLLDKRNHEILKSNCQVLAMNIPFTESMCQSFVDQNVIDKRTADAIRKEMNVTNKMSLTLESIKMKHEFDTFCDILIVCGHPLIADYLKNEVFETSDPIVISELWHEIPSLQNLQKSEKESLCDLIKSKIQSEILKQKLRHASTIGESATDIKEKYVKQSWKHLKEMTQTTLSIKEMKHSVSILENSVKEKIAEIKSLKESMKNMKEQHSMEQAVSNRFNMANDKALRQLQESLGYHIDLINHIQNSLQKRSVLETRADLNQKDLTFLEQEQNALTDQLRLEEMRDIFTKFMKYVEELEGNVLESQALRSDVTETIAILDRESNMSRCSGNLHAARVNYTLFMEERFNKQSAEIKLLQDFIHQKLSDSDIPESLRNLSLPAQLRAELEKQINQLVAEVLNNQVLLEERTTHINQLESELKQLQQSTIVADKLDSEIQTVTPTISQTDPSQAEEKQHQSPTKDTLTDSSLKFSYPLGVVERQMKAKRLLVQEVREKKPQLRLEADFVLHSQPIKSKNNMVMQNKSNQRPNVTQRPQIISTQQIPLVPYSSPNGTMIFDIQQKDVQESGFRTESQFSKQNLNYKLLMYDVKRRGFPSLQQSNVTK